MKAIIMAGGEGSRLRPLTCGRPKPMVPVLNKPIMNHIINLLTEHGFSDIGVTLQYQPQEIKDYFGSGYEYGVNLQYFVEETPLGTAGSVKNAAGFLDETFVVISGDALTDLDLSRALEFHKKQGALATLVLTRVDCPLEYGVVITGEDGKITRFLEKPGWGEVFSDTVNTGIYVLEPEVLDYFAPGQKFDFSKDLFPLLLREKKPLFGLVMSGYWCDIGNLQQYLQAHQDALAGKVGIRIPGKEVMPGVWAGKGAFINPAASVQGPVLLGANCQVGAAAKIDPYSVLGEGCLVHEHASLKRSVLWNNVYVGNSAALRGAVVGSRVQVQAGAGIYEGAVVGDDSIIRENSLLKPDVKLWPHKLVETGATVQGSMVWGTCYPKKIFGLEGVSGLVNVEITPEFASRVGTAFSTVNGGAGARLAVSSDNDTALVMIKKALVIGMQSAGAEVLDLGTGITPVHRYGVRALSCKGGVHVKVSPYAPDKIVMVFTNARGGNISRGQERKMENTLAREDFLRAEANRIKPPVQVSGMDDKYIKEICGDTETGLYPGLKLLIGCDGVNLDKFIDVMGKEINLTWERYDFSNNGTGFHSWPSLQNVLPEIAQRVVASGSDVGVVLEPNADYLILIDEKGRVIQDDLLTALFSLMILKEKGGPVVVPVTAPKVIEIMAQQYHSKVIRTKTSLQDFIDQVLLNSSESQTIFSLHADVFFALVRVLKYIMEHKTSLSALIEEIPAFFVNRREVPVPWEFKGRVIRQLIQEPPSHQLELTDGVKVYHQDGWALVLPDPDEPVCRVFSEGSTMEIAESLTDMYIDKINQIVNKV